MIPFLKAVNADMTSLHDPRFVYPKQGPVSERPGRKGLHGYPFGIGFKSYMTGIDKPRYLIVMVNDADACLTPGHGKSTFMRGEVVEVHTDLRAATASMAEHTRNWQAPAAAAYAERVGQGNVYHGDLWMLRRARALQNGPAEPKHAMAQAYDLLFAPLPDREEPKLHPNPDKPLMAQAYDVTFGLEAVTPPKTDAAEAERERLRRQAERQAQREFWRQYVLVQRPDQAAILVEGWPVPDLVEVKR